MALANQQAQRVNYDSIGTEHILLGLLKEGTGVAANVLKNLDVDLRDVRMEIEKRIPKKSAQVPMGKLPFTPGVKRVTQSAIEEARNLKHKYVGTEHLLLALLNEQEGIVAEVLVHFGLTFNQVREETRALLGETEEDPARDHAGTPQDVDGPALVLLLDPGSATAEEIAELLYEFSTLYRMLGGSGITFSTTDAREPAFA